MHAVLPAQSRLWGAGRPSYPDEPPGAAAVTAGARAWREAGVSFVVSLIEDWEVPRRAPGLFDALAREGIELERYPIVDFGVPREGPGSPGCSATSSGAWPPAMGFWFTAMRASAGRRWCSDPS